MDVSERIALVTREPTEEVVTHDELRTLFETKSRPRHYIGLEISGVLHLGSLVLTGFKINDFIKAGIECTVFLADWHTYINDKLGGDWDKIRQVSQYYADAFRLFCPGVKIVTGSDLYKNTPDYWENFVRFSKQMTLARTMRTHCLKRRSSKQTDRRACTRFGGCSNTQKLSLSKEATRGDSPGCAGILIQRFALRLPRHTLFSRCEER